MNNQNHRLIYETEDLAAFARELEQLRQHALPQRISTDSDDVERGLAQLVLTLIELLRQLMERQALRRIEHGSLSDEEIEQLGATFIKLKQRMDELKQTFGLTDEDLNIHLGPLGDLL